jgi:hypothetical protein
MSVKNFLQRLIRNFSPRVFKPVPQELLYVLMQSVERELGGECPWTTELECQKGHTLTYWADPVLGGARCRNINCPGYLHPWGLIGYTSRSSDKSTIDNRFDYSSFRYLAGDGNDWVNCGTLGALVKFDFGLGFDPGGYGAGFYGAGYYGYNGTTSTGSNVVIGDKWYVACRTASTVFGSETVGVGTPKTYVCQRKHTSNATNRPITGAFWQDYWKEGGLNRSLYSDGSTQQGLVADYWAADVVYDVVPVVKHPVADPANRGSYGPVQSMGTYRGDYSTIYTVEIIDFRGWTQDFYNGLLQISLATCDLEWLDYWGEYFGLQRLLLPAGYEGDEIYRARIMKEITRAKTTRAVILEEAINYFQNTSVTVAEYHQQNVASVVVGSDGYYYTCIQSHTASAINKPITGANWTSFWQQRGLAGNEWTSGLYYTIDITPHFDGPVTALLDPANGLWPWQFYINVPTQRSPSTKFVKHGPTLYEPEEYTGVLLPDGEVAIYAQEGLYSGVGYGFSYGEFVQLTNLTTINEVDDSLFLPPGQPYDNCLFGSKHPFSGLWFMLSGSWIKYGELPVPRRWGEPGREYGERIPLDGGVGGSYVWEYWTGGAWQLLAVWDPSYIFAVDGFVSWKVPAGWAPADNISTNIPNTGTDMYWVRCRITTAPTTIPIADYVGFIYAGQTCRGHYCGTNTTQWAALTPYVVNRRTYPDVYNGYWFECIQSGISGASVPMSPGSLGPAIPWGNAADRLCAEDLIIDGTVIWRNLGPAYQMTPYSPTTRDKNNCYIYFESSFAKPTWESGLQPIIDRIKCAGTVCIINPIDV